LHDTRVPETGAMQKNKSRLMAPVSGACAMGIRDYKTAGTEAAGLSTLDTR